MYIEAHAIIIMTKPTGVTKTNEFVCMRLSRQGVSCETNRRNLRVTNVNTVNRIVQSTHKKNRTSTHTCLVWLSCNIHDAHPQSLS